MVDVRSGKCQHLAQPCEDIGNGAMTRIARKLIYVMLVIVVLLVIWQFLGSL